ncbi:hypothetical protein KCU65_g5156, partial [Aureobasidium melanogenum]
MSQPHELTAARRISAHYGKLCLAHGTRPSEIQVRNIELAVQPIPGWASSKGFHYALLYFVSKSTFIIQQNTLLLGWNLQADGSRVELWFKHDETGSHVCRKSGAAEVIRCRIDEKKPLCDQWHLSVGEIFEPWLGGGRHKRCALYTYLAATIKLIKANHQRTSSEDHARLAEHEGVFEDDSSAVTTNRSTISTVNRKKRLRAQKDLESEQSSEENMTLRVPSKSARRTRSSVAAAKTSVVDLAESGRARDIKIESSTTTLIISHNKTQPHVTTAEHKIQELRKKMQSKTVAEINNILAEKAGILPSWIEDLIREELEKKMLRDLQTVENLYDRMKYHQQEQQRDGRRKGFAFIMKDI